MILIMSVEPGLGGQKYIDASTERIAQTRKMINESGMDIDVEVDGGVYLGNLKTILDAGANVIVSGSAIFNGDVAENNRKFVEIMNG